MAKVFIAILLVIASAQALPDLARLRGFAWLRDMLDEAQAKRRGLGFVLGVPALLVDGRYLVGGPNIKNNVDLLAIADKLVERIRVERRLKK